MLKPLTIVTAASSNHFNPLLNLIFTATAFEPDARIIAYDIGLTDDERSRLADVPDFSWRGELRRFPFENYPPHFAMDRMCGQWCWRPLIVADVARQFGGIVLWLDAGTVICRRLAMFRAEILRSGCWARPMSGTVGESLFESTKSVLLDRDGKIAPMPMVDAGVCGFDVARSMSLIESWAAAAMDQPVSSPDPEYRKSLHPDAVFAALYHRAGYPVSTPSPGDIHIKQDTLTLREVQYRLNRSIRSL